MADDLRDRRGSGVSMLAYWLVTISIYFIVAIPFFIGGWGKISPGMGAPAGIAESFQGTFLARFPGVDVIWFILGIMELLVVVGLLISIFTGEFLPSRSKPWLLATLGWALIVFASLSFGQNLSGNHEGAATQWAYFSGTGVLFLVASKLPRRTFAHWWNCEADIDRP